MSRAPWISLLTLLPLIGCASVLICGGRRTISRTVAAIFAAAALAMTAALWIGFAPGRPGMQFEELRSWAPSLGLQYHVGIDGLGLLMLTLTAVVVLMSLAASWRNEAHGAGYFALVLSLEAGLFGAFTALNFLHWFIFWELSLIPSFFLIRLWGGADRRRAATQFFVYSMVGSICLLLAFLALYSVAGSFDFIELARMAQSGQLTAAIARHADGGFWSGGHLSALLFWGAFLGFAVKTPVYPFHGWLPAAYAEAPAETTMLLTGALSKMGVYGFLRILLPIFPGQMQHLLTPLLWMAAASIVLPAFSAWAQKDLKRMFAHSSINHLGYCLLGVCAIVKLSGPGLAAERESALTGVMLQMFAHGITAASLFWFVALIERRSGGVRGVMDFGGLRKIMPVFAGMMGIVFFASLGLPGLIGFPGEFLIFKGAFPLVTSATWFAALGLLITAVFLLTAIEKVFSGELNQRWKTMPDLTVAERLALAPAIALIFVLGLYPQIVTGMLHTTVLEIVARVRF